MDPQTGMPDSHEVLDVAMEAGHIQLENGAEIARVEETMRRISRHYGVEDGAFFVLSNGIFTTGEASQKGGPPFARVRHIPVHGTQLDRVIAVNQLSRDIAAQDLSLDEVRRRLAEIRKMPAKPFPLQVLASGVGSGCFCVLFGGSLWDACAAFAAGLLLYIFVLKAAVHMSKIVGNILSSAFVTLLCLLFSRIGFGTDMNHMIIGAIIPLIPGVAFTNGIRDIADGDYISGSVRLLDAILVFMCIAMGVGAVLSVYHMAVGGVLP